MRITLLMIYILIQLSAETNWEFKKRVNEIDVFFRNVPGSKFKEFRGITEMDTDLKTLVAIFYQPENMKLWLKDTLECKLLDRPSITNQIHYVRNDAPWPVRNRDGIYEYIYEISKNKSNILIRTFARPDYLPNSEKNIRVTVSRGSFSFNKKMNGKVEVIYQLFVEPGGKIPHRVMNLFITKTPVRMLEGIKKEITKEKYQSIKIPFFSGSFNID